MSRGKNEISPTNSNEFDISTQGIFSNFLTNFLSDSLWNNNSLKVDVREKPDAYIIDAEMPGLNKDNINIDIIDNIMTISAHVDGENEQKDEAGHFLRRERHTESFRRSFALNRINAEEIKAEMNNGILTVYCPKKDKSLPNLRRVEIK